MPDRVRLELAFEGGQIVGAIVAPDAAEELAKALGAGTAGTFELETADGSYLLPLARIVYVKRFARETTIGFGGNA
ncbi:MAG TPA: hypothetical protein VK285_01030 [Gaiellaceae bacterium]|nr:hypothetical protein [Gaiellaceae bacterium]